MHKWSSVICTASLLLICLTGLPLVFADEIDAWSTPPTVYATVPPGTPNVSLDRLAGIAGRMYPDEVITGIVIDDDEPQVFVSMAPSWPAFTANRRVRHFIAFDAHTARVIEQSKPEANEPPTVMDLVLSLHRDLFAGLAGELFLATMGLLFVTAVVSGVVLYGPFMRKLDFGTVRDHRSRRIRWLDLHNLLGVITVAWAIVMGTTGVMNELSTPLFAIWQRTDVAAMLAPWRGAPPPSEMELSSVQGALETAERAAPGMTFTSVTYPGDVNGSPYHYLFWGHGSSNLTSRLFTPVLVDARTGQLTAVVETPWYLHALDVSVPLHFGDYGGLPLKIIWALLDLMTVVVLASGLYLWLSRRQPVVGNRVDALEPMESELGRKSIRRVAE
jgi:uncharacterized iron-regulated membrane protein